MITGDLSQIFWMKTSHNGNLSDVKHRAQRQRWMCFLIENSFSDEFDTGLNFLVVLFRFPIYIGLNAVLYQIKEQ